MFADNLSQPAANSIARDGATDGARGDKTGPKRGASCFANSQDQELSAMSATI